MPIKPLYDPQDGELRLAGLMSGSGTNLRKIIEHERRLKAERGAAPYRVAVIFSDTWDSQAASIGRDFDVPVLIRDLRAFYRARGRPRKDLAVREEFDRETVRALAPFAVRAAAYAGYMSIATKALSNAFLGVNVHPADLAIEENGKRKYVGDHAVRAAIAAGEKTIASTTHVIEETVDGGRLLMISKPLPVELPSIADLTDAETLEQVAALNQARLKEHGDWAIFPLTLEFLALGRYGADERGALYFDSQPIPRGLRRE